MNILGINEGHMSSACLIKDGVLVAAVCEERFTRNKNEQGYPERAIEYCLKEGKITNNEIDCVATATEELQAVFEATQRYRRFTISDYIKENNEYWKPKLLENKEVNYFDLFPELPNNYYDFSFLKEELTELLIEKICPIGEEIKKLLKDQKHLKSVLKEGNLKANMVANNKLNKMVEITKEQFEAYIDVQESGVTNMFNAKLVGELSGLKKEEIMEIMKNYGTLKDKYDE